MTQRVFDVENEKDMADLWDILPDKITKIKKPEIKGLPCFSGYDSMRTSDLITINWNDKTEITRPVQEVTKADIGKICVFWDDNPDNGGNIGILTCISDCYSTLNGKVEFEKHRYQCGGISWEHCRRLTKQEIEELC